jgi:hypothetical protein
LLPGRQPEQGAGDQQAEEGDDQQPPALVDGEAGQADEDADQNMDEKTSFDERNKRQSRPIIC